MGDEIYLKLIHEDLERIAVALERRVQTSKDAIDVEADLSEYKAFDWAGIGAEIVTKDNNGPTRVSSRGKIYTRRSPVNKFSPAIWYSRCTGKNESGDNEYERLITFKNLSEYDPDPLPDKVEAAINSARAPRPAAPERPTAATTSTGRKPTGDFKPAVQYSDYFKRASELGFDVKMAREIATMAGIDFRKAYKGTDYTLAGELLNIAHTVINAENLDIGWLRDNLEEFNGDIPAGIASIKRVLSIE